MIIHSWDTAIKAGQGNDYSVCAVFSWEDESHRLVDVWRAQVEYPELKRRVYQLVERDEPHAVLIEDKASGQSLIQDVKRESNLPIIAIMPQGDKITRFARITPMLEAGQVALPRYASWLSAFESELLSFPSGAHDDQVDAFSQYLNWVRQKQWDGLGVRRV